MTDTLVTCPHCGTRFPLNEALAAQLRAGLDAEHEARLKVANVAPWRSIGPSVRSRSSG
jgi:hypothetical protein